VAAEEGDALLTAGLKGVKGFGLRCNFVVPLDGEVAMDNFFMLCARSKVGGADVAGEDGPPGLLMALDCLLVLAPFAGAVAIFGNFLIFVLTEPRE